jgi:hypothetical protein
MNNLEKISVIKLEDVSLDDIFKYCNEDSWKDSKIAKSRYSSELGEGVNKNIRNASVAPMTEQFYTFLNNKIEPHVIKYSKIHNIAIHENTGYSVTRYLKGQFFVNHTDSTPEFPRKISTILYLNDNYKGGTITFTKINKTFKPEANSLFIFPSGEDFSHSADPVEDGVKYVVVGFWT